MAQCWLDEQAYAGAEHLDAAYVAGYERKAGFDPADDVEVLRRHGLGDGSVVVDLDADTGVFAAEVAPLCRRVIAVDVSSEMVSAPRSRVVRPGGVLRLRDLVDDFEPGDADLPTARTPANATPADAAHPAATARMQVTSRPSSRLAACRTSAKRSATSWLRRRRRP